MCMRAEGWPLEPNRWGPALCICHFRTHRVNQLQEKYSEKTFSSVLSKHRLLPEQYRVSATHQRLHCILRHRKSSREDLTHMGRALRLCGNLTPSPEGLELLQVLVPWRSPPGRLGRPFLGSPSPRPAFVCIFPVSNELLLTWWNDCLQGPADAMPTERESPSELQGQNWLCSGNTDAQGLLWPLRTPGERRADPSFQRTEEAQTEFHHQTSSSFFF